MEEKQTIIFEEGQRVKFIDPETFDPRIGNGFEVRGRILYIQNTGEKNIDPMLQVMIDGRSLATWIKSSDVKGERE